MNICARCGNIIQEWQHGVCYTCARNDQELKRYGRRRPRPYPKTEDPTPLPPIVRPRLRKDKPSGRTPKARRVSRKVSRPNKTVCPVCKGIIFTDQLKDHVYNNHTKIDIQRSGVNRFLKDVFSHRFLLSELLHSQGLEQADIERVSQRKEGYVMLLLKGWEQVLYKTMSHLQAQILVSYYGWDGGVEKLFDISRRVGVPYQEAKSQYEAALTCVKRPEIRGRLQGEAVRVARKMLTQ